MTLFAAIQLTSGSNYQENIGRAFKFIEIAAGNGAKVVALPETFTFIGDKSENGEYKQSIKGDLVSALGNIAGTKGIYLLAGSFHKKTADSSKVYNTSMLFSPEGKILHTYRKIHLFDVEVENGPSIRESDNFMAGGTENTEITATTYGNFGITICYDLRFPELYRKLTMKGAEIIFVPSAFTMETGKDHWEVLLRARAIENQVYIVAPNQFGRHSPKRNSYGNSMIIDPWGKVISRASDKEGIIYGDIDLGYLRKVRKSIPCLKHVRLINDS